MFGKHDLQIVQPLPDQENIRLEGANPGLEEVPSLLDDFDNVRDLPVSNTC